MNTQNQPRQVQDISKSDLNLSSEGGFGVAD